VFTQAVTLPTSDVGLAGRVAFAAAHALLLVVVSWSLLFLVREFSVHAARALLGEPLLTGAVTLGVAVPTLLLGYALFAVGGLGTLLASAVAMVLAPAVVVADALVAVAAGWLLVGLAGDDPDQREDAVVLAGGVAAAVVWVLPVVGPALGVALVALGFGAGTRALLAAVGYRGAVAAGAATR